MLTVRKSTHEHGGKVVFESQEGQGSVFRLIFPRENLPVPTEGDEMTEKSSQMEEDK